MRNGGQYSVEGNYLINPFHSGRCCFLHPLQEKIKFFLSLNDVILYLSSNDDKMILRRDIFQAIAEPTRRSILFLLASHTLTAGSIAAKFGSARSTISKHIQILTECGLVTADQQGREIYYQIQIDRMKEIDLWVEQVRKEWEERFDNLDLYVKKIQNTKK